MNNNKIKILQIGKFTSLKGGIEETAFLLSQGLSADGFICDYLCYNKKVCKKYCDVKNFNLIKVQPWITIKSICISPSMPFVLKKICKDYDIIHIHHPDPMAVLSLYISGYKGKVVLHWHNNIQKFGGLKNYYKTLINWLIKRSNIIVCTSFTYMMTSPDLEEAVENNKVVYIPTGITPIESKKDEVSIIQNKYLNKKIIFSIGQLVEYNGYEQLIYSAQYLSNDYVILIGGKGPQKRQLKHLIENLELTNKVVLLGKLNSKQKAIYMNSCNIFCMPSISYSESSEINMIEAMSCKKPIVATISPCSGVCWINKNEITGINVQGYDESALARAFINILENEDIYERYSKNAQNRYEKWFTLKKMTNYFIELYNNVFNDWNSIPKTIFK